MHTHTAPIKTQELKQKYSSKNVWVMLKAQKQFFFGHSTYTQKKLPNLMVSLH